MPLRLLTLNIEGDRHIERVSSVIHAHRPDIVCLQEVLERDVVKLAALGPYQAKFALSGVLPNPTDELGRNWGLAVLTRLPVQAQSITYYADDLRIRTIEKPNDPRRVLIVTELEHRGLPYRIITTHFTWSPEGQINDEQRIGFMRLKQVLTEYSHYILCGDMNAPRGREMFSMFISELRLIDHLPQSVTTTIDPRFHAAGALELVVDALLSTPEYEGVDVSVLEGISDHKAILATVERREPSGRRSQTR